MAAWLRTLVIIATVFVAVLAPAPARAMSASFDAPSLAAALVFSPAQTPSARQAHPSHARPERSEDGRKGGVGRARAPRPAPERGWATPFAPMAHREASGEWIQYLNDPAGAPDALVDARGNVACEYERTVWGYGEARAGARATTPVRFQGQYADEETGLAYNRYRYVLGETHDFCSYDPLGLEGGINPYGRIPDPFAWTHPWGLLRDCALRRKLSQIEEMAQTPGTRDSAPPLTVDK